ncbi:acyl-CoA dehydrogenase C-terminal domain-containing protein [Flagellatimonas centrodinii]|uniref:acyl-CoA dehydrogenase family protein n=1 Tax=Flagellatimonas centrodinii TaxID=2806210 RepID=UPI001FEEC272|nr:acyl-CoA dehydrogenase family protein [Flagellatimonas centrodinii]ULQ45605.1 acyl-CoA dehydrogenase C-terminal domain-containing protein [Flagellatimonas centrodinii]
MATYKAPLREIGFVLKDVLNVGQLSQLPAYSEVSDDMMIDLADEASKLIEDQIAAINHAADAEGCRLDGHDVTVPKGMAEAYKLYWESGWVGLSNPTEFGGQGLPYTLSKVVEEMLCSANVAFALYPGLTTGCFEAILASGDDAQKQTYLPKLATGEWTGTMCITEPQAGSDLAAVKTRALPQDDGSYLIEGGKIFITSGEHTMADNIVHFVLARLPDSPPGVKGLSTFVVPKFLVNADGSLGERNKLYCASIEHKMGINASCTCSMQFEGARGWMVGAPNTGIQNMFVMMNLARIMVGFQGLGQCELATQNAVAYAKDRTQGKAFNGQPEILNHPDVRRMLMRMKATTEGARVLAYETAMYVDIAHHHPDTAVREEAQDWVDLNTPLVKAYCTDSAFELGSEAIQVYGGHGFIREHGIEQIARDSKILCLYEGTNGIQAMDLVRRKLMLHGGRLPQRFFARVRGDLNGEAPLGFIVRPLSKAIDELESTTQWLQQSFKETPDDGAFGCVDYQRAFALTYLGYNWLRMAKAAHTQSDEVFRAGKLATAEFFASRMLSQVPVLLANVRQPAQNLMALDARHF